ncbi:MAG: NAD(P)-dependent oxidoreductase [Acidobacteriota bacterium]
MNETVGFIGLGAMGLPIAGNLRAAGYPLRVHNRTMEKAKPLLARGAEPASSPAEAAPPGGIVFTMVSDDAALSSIVESPHFLERLGAGGVHVSMSTVAPKTARDLARRHAQAGSVYLAAPVFGRPDAAAAKLLWICLSGAAAARERARPLLSAIGQRTVEFGDDPGAANVVKLCGNFLIASSIEMMAEAWTLAEKNAIAPAEIAKFFSETLFAAPVFKNYGAAVAEKRYSPPGFRLALGLKDVELVLGAARESKAPMPIASLLRDRLLAAVARGRGDLDWSALGIGAAEDAGLS